MRHAVRIAAALVIVWLSAAPATAVHPGLNVFVPAAATGPGASGSLWVTSLYIVNPGSEAANLTLSWLVRGRANPQPLTVPLTLPGGATRVWENAVQELFGLSTGYGAIRVVGDHSVVVTAAILNRAGGREFGQSSEGIPFEASLRAGTSSHAAGLRHNAAYRSNVYLLDATGTASRAKVRLVDAEGVTIAKKSYELGAYQPVLEPATSLAGVTSFDLATMVVEVESGAVIAGASRISGGASLPGSGDPITLSTWWELPNRATTGEVSDIDGNRYRTVLIGSQWWMAESLRVTRSGSGQAVESFVYNNDPSLQAAYGRLYRWSVAMGGSSQPGAPGLCPNGWRIPSDDDWEALFETVGGEAVAGGRLKETGTSHWFSPNADATDAFGFAGRPGGGYNGTAFQGIGVAGHFWSSTGNGGSAGLPTLHKDYASVLRLFESTSLAHSVRCVRNVSPAGASGTGSARGEAAVSWARDAG